MSRPMLKVLVIAVTAATFAYGAPPKKTTRPARAQQVDRRNEKARREANAKTFFAKKDYARAIEEWEYLSSIDGNAVENPIYEQRIVVSYFRSKDRLRGVNRLVSIIAKYGPKSFWADANRSKKGVVERTQMNMEELAVRYAFMMDAESQGKKASPESAQLADRLYQTLITEFPESKEHAKYRSRLAGLWMRKGDYSRAADLYFEVFQKSLTSQKKDERALAYAITNLRSLLAVERKNSGLYALDLNGYDRLPELADLPVDAKPYSQVEQTYISWVEQYQKHFSELPLSHSLAYSKAYLQYHHLDFKRALPGMRELTGKNVTVTLREGAARVALDMIERQKQYSEMVTVCKEMLQTNWTPTFRSFLQASLRKSEIEMVRVIEEKGDYLAAAEGYVKYTRAYGSQDDKLYEDSLYKAIMNYGRAGEIEKSVDTQERFVKFFPKSKRIQEVSWDLAQNYAAMSEFSKAARSFEGLSREMKSESKQNESLKLSAQYYWAAGEFTKAESLFRKLGDKSAKQAKFAENEVHDMYETEGASRKIASLYRKAISKEDVSSTEKISKMLKVAELRAPSSQEISQSEIKKIFDLAEEHKKELRRNKTGRELLSKLMLWSVRDLEREFYSVRLRMPKQQLTKSVARKQKLLAELEQKLKMIERLGIEEANLGVFYKRASAYAHFMNEGQEVLKGIDVKDLSDRHYLTSKEQTIVEPYFRLASHSAAQCLQYASDYHLFSEWTAQCYSVASQIDPQQFPAARSYYLPAVQTALIMPDEKTSRIGKGDMTDVPFIGGTGYFSLAPERTLASFDPAAEKGRGQLADIESDGSMNPKSMSYQFLSGERVKQLQQATAKVDFTRLEQVTFSDLNKLRLLAPDKAVSVIQRMVRRDPKSDALQNLLALAHMESGNYAAAKVIWKTMLRRAPHLSAVKNNLGVLAVLGGREKQAIGLFREARNKSDSPEAAVNLGMLAIKYRNGAEARENFEEALYSGNIDLIAVSRAGLLIGQMLNRELNPARDSLQEILKAESDDAFSKLAAASFLIDIEQAYPQAAELVSKYIASHSLEISTTPFHKVLDEAQTKAKSELVAQRQAQTEEAPVSEESSQE